MRHKGELDIALHCSDTAAFTLYNFTSIWLLFMMPFQVMTHNFSGIIKHSFIQPLGLWTVDNLHANPGISFTPWEQGTIAVQTNSNDYLGDASSISISTSYIIQSEFESI
jgi:hypothetical protein